MVRDDDSEDIAAGRAQALAQALDLAHADAPVLARERPRRVQARDDHLPVLVKGFEVVRDVAPEFFERRAEAREHVPERHVVVAGDDDLRVRQGVEKGARLLKLAGARALRQVAGDDHQRRPRVPHRLRQRPDHAVVNAPEVQV